VAPPGAPSPLSRGTEKGKRAGPGARIQSPGTMTRGKRGMLPEICDQVPTASGACILRSIAITDSATFLPFTRVGPRRLARG
jgi:hypothetical protein